MSEFERFPKLESPFTRYHNEFGEYLVKDEINEDYDWVFNSESVRAIEKLDGMNIAVKFSESRDVESIYTREGKAIRPFIDAYESYIVKGILEACQRGWVSNLKSDELHYGELVGPKVKGNPYSLRNHIWVPFSYAYDNLYYESWGEYPNDFDSISAWFKDGLQPLFYSRIHNETFDSARKNGYVEGIVFTHDNGKKSKLRRDMFDWYEGVRHEERE